MKRIVTLTTDFGYNDYYVGAVKGHLYKLLRNDTQLVDISHQVAPFDLQQAAYILKHSYVYFPEGSIHIIGIDTEKTPENRHLVVLYNKHYFVVSDNGLMSLIIGGDSQAEKVVEIAHQRNTVFATLNIFCDVAAQLTNGIDLLDLGHETRIKNQINLFRPFLKGDSEIFGNVVHIDCYGNIITDITRNLVDNTGLGRSFEIIAGRITFTKIYDRFSDIVDFSVDRNDRDDSGAPLALYDKNDHLMISMYRSNHNIVGGASSLLGLEVRNQMKLTFI